MIYILQGGEELVKLDVDRINKKLKIATSQTQYAWVEQPFWKLFGNKAGDVREARSEQAAMDILDDNQFNAKLVSDFAKNGYKLIKQVG